MVRRRNAVIRDNDELISRRRREAEEWVTLLTDLANRHTRTERERDGEILRGLLPAYVLILSSSIS